MQLASNRPPLVPPLRKSDDDGFEVHRRIRSTGTVGPSATLTGVASVGANNEPLGIELHRLGYPAAMLVSVEDG